MAALVALAVLVPAAPALALAPAAPVPRLSGDDFDPGAIISDAAFYDGRAMSAAEVQVFLDERLAVCDTWRAGRGDELPPFVCLKDYRQTVPTLAADEYCARVDGGTLTAAQIIAAVGRACGISQRTLLVLLQNEQSLVTDPWPWISQYERATGFSCPDTADCDPAFGGFVYQVYYAARQFQMYRRHPDSYNFRAGETVAIRYHPNADCGAVPVTIANEATAGLYNYTPYTPNAAALAALHGSGDACSSYGNRNFWRIWHEWFDAADGG